MAGIYIHIPFCKGKCAYCDFYSVANQKLINDFVVALGKEIELQKNYFGDDVVKTIYFGGGTPSMLTINQIETILNEIYNHYKIDTNIELTLEANPDNLTIDYLNSLKRIGFNRLSIGIQSFRDSDLHLMKRKHTVKQAISSVKNARDIGFENISVDLIYGLPNLSLQEWEKNIQYALELKIQHISAYHLTIEKNTLFKKWFDEGKIILPSEDESLNQFNLLIEKTSENGFLHYEISNFAKDGFISLHNANYWMNVKYLGLGPSAHSCNLTSRQWNIQNLQVYLSGIFQGKLPNEVEILSKNDLFNDFIITSIRTMWGINSKKIENEFGNYYSNYFQNHSKKYIDSGHIIKLKNNYHLSKKGIFISDEIMSSLIHD